MKSKFAESRVFIRGAARRNDLVYILSKGKALMEQDISNTSAIGIYQGRWVDAEDTEWDSSAIAVATKPTEKLVFIGEDGDVCTYVGGKSTREIITPTPKMIRRAKTVEGIVVACGMMRQVFRRIAENQWEDVSAPYPKEGEEAGFEAIDGYSLDELYAVGWNGEIWKYDGSSWINQASPTNLILTAICCAPDSTVYVGGQQGTLIKGHSGTWEIVDWEDEVDVDIWGLSWFNNRLYVATMTNIFILDGGQLTAVEFGDIEMPSCYDLTTAEGVMWSIGEDDILSYDGSTWISYD